MKAKIKMFFFLMVVITAATLVFRNQTSVLPIMDNNLILINATALASECKTDEVIGSKFSVKCGTPINDRGGQCSKTVVTCQGSKGCCKRDYCSDHM